MSELKTSDFYYELPKESIAQSPAEPRDASRLLCYLKEEDRVEHRHFRDLPEYLRAGDVLVVNRTKVIPARLFATNEAGRRFEILLLKRLERDRWECLMKPARKGKIGGRFFLSDKLSFTLEGVGEEGVRVIAFEYDGVFEELLDELGEAPLPPYITERNAPKERYQTVYAKEEGSAAAPTAGLHFTEELLAKIRAMGVEIVEVLLHVGLGTFRPVKTEKVEEHTMHAEWYQIGQNAADAINRAKKEGRRIIAVGTTSVRALESAADEFGKVKAGSAETSIYIYPPYRFKTIEGLITNFHLPESTLIMLVSAFVGREKTLELYRLAVKEGYRFFSFGDAMLLL